MNNFTDSFERLLQKHFALSRKEDDRSWNALFREYLELKAESGYTFFNEILRRTVWGLPCEWKALTIVELSIPVTSDSGRVIDQMLIAQNVQSGSVASVEARVIKYDISLNKNKVRDALQISLRKHGRAETITTFELAVELGWLDEAHAAYWLKELTNYIEKSEVTAEVEIMPALF
ncbi:MAG: hypothetical protein IPG58_19840 [Acidobacteria bacterium]|nr:hypothetical protein [Acidobacteriota bacterium]